MDKFIIRDFVKFIINRNISIIDVMLAYYQEIYHQQALRNRSSSPEVTPIPKTSEAPVAENEAIHQQKHPEHNEGKLNVLLCASKDTKSESIDEVSPSVMAAADDMPEKKADIEFHCPAEDQNVPGYVNLNYQGPFTPEEYHLKLQDGGTILDVIESKGMAKGVYKKRRVRGSNIIDSLSKPVQLRKNNAASFTLGQLSNIMKMNFKQLLELIHEGGFPGPDVDNNKWSLKKLQTIPEFLKNYRAGE